VLSSGDRLADRYRIETLVGRGGTATVYRARDERLDRDVAIKVLLEPLSADPAITARFEREARALAAVSDPHVITVHDVVDAAEGESAFLVLELADDGTLADRIKRGGALPPPEVTDLVAAIGAALDALHHAGLVHRDVKPGNVLFVAGRPKLGDLGVARTAATSATGADDPTITTDGMLVGTLRYLAPELLEGEPATPAGDAYGLAATALEALTGMPARRSTSLAGIVAEARALPPRVSVLAPALGTGYDELFGAALHPDPAVRLVPRLFAERLAAIVASPGAQLPAAASQPAAGAGPTDPGATTVLVPPPSPARVPAFSTTPPAAAVPPVIAAPARRNRPSALVLVLGAAVAVVVLLVVANALPGLSAVTASIPATSPAIPSGEAPVVTASAVSGSATAPSAVGLAVNDRIDALGEAIDVARGGGDGLRGRDANDLARRLDAVKEALAADDLGAARSAAADLAARIEELGNGKRLAEAKRDRLATAATALVDALSG
jgi:tRNA A-37 threonylcarbamoyl transferase component Bud32